MADQWHLSKTVNMGTITMVIVLLVGQIYTFGVVMAKFESSIDALNYKVDLLTSDRVHKQTVDQMFANRDIQITELRQRLARIDERMADNNKLLQRLLDKLDKE